MIGRSNIESEEKVFVSLFEGYKDSRPKEVVSLSTFLLQPKYRKEVEEVRKCRTNNERRRLKSKLPAVTPSGIFSIRNSQSLIKHSGLICIDIDAEDNPDVSDWEALKSTISKFRGLWYAGLSVSGNGLFMLFKIKETTKHLNHFNSIVKDLEAIDLKADKACKDISRLRGVSYDLNPIYRPQTEPYEGLLIEKEATHKQTPMLMSSKLQCDDLTAFRVNQLVEAIERTNANIADYYPDWFAIGRSLASEFGEQGRGWFHTISQQSDKYNNKECNEQYNNCLKNCSQTTISTLFWYCKKNGIIAKL